jgi:hypothetical protein
MAYEKVTPGQRIKSTPFSRATFMNDTVELVNAYNEGRLSGTRGITRGDSSRVVVEVRNSTGGDRARGEVVQLGDHLLDDVSEEHPWFDADLVAAPVLQRMAILLKPIKEDAIGSAMLAGVCLARVDVSNANHTHAYPVSGDAELASGYNGPLELLMEPDGTGVQDLWALIDLSPRGKRLGKANSAISINTGASNNVSLWAGTPGSESDTGIDFTAYNKFGEIDSGAWVWCEDNGSGWYITSAVCPA